MSQTPDATTSFSKDLGHAFPDDSDANSNSDSSHTDSNSDTDSNVQPKLEIDLLLSREGDMLGMLTASRTNFTVEDAKTEFIRRINEKHGIQPDMVKEAILAITPYPAVMRHVKGVTIIFVATSVLMSTLRRRTFTTSNSSYTPQSLHGILFLPKK